MNRDYRVFMYLGLVVMTSLGVWFVTASAPVESMPPMPTNGIEACAHACQTAGRHMVSYKRQPGTPSFAPGPNGDYEDCQCEPASPAGSSR